MQGFDKLDKLLASEIISLTFVLTSAISTIIIMSKLPKYTHFLFSAPHILTSFLMFMLYVLPSILKFTLPISLLISCAIVIMRMSVDRELEAWMSCGVSISRICVMPTLLGLAVMFVSLMSGLFFEPYSNRRFDEFKWLQSKSLVESFIKSNLIEKSFLYDFKESSHSPLSGETKLSMYFGNVNSDKTKMEDVFIAFSNSDQIYSSLLVAKSGELSRDSSTGYPDYILKLNDGHLYTYQKSQRSFLKLMEKTSENHYIFHNYDQIKKELNLYPIPLNWSVTDFDKADLSLVSLFRDKFKADSGPQNQMDQLYPKEFLAELSKEKAKNERWQEDPAVIDKMVFFIKQIAVPCAVFFLPVIGVCLGILDPRRKQFSVYLGIGIVLFFMYFSLSIAQQLIQKLILSPYSLLFITPSVLGCLFLIVYRWRLLYPPSCSFLEYVNLEYVKFTKALLRRG
jgi:lipopolysaccharide export LptBFGC system permease protein LptF